MGQLLSLLGAFAAIFAVIGLLWLVAWKLKLLKPASKASGGGGGEDAGTKAAGLAYSVRGEVLSAGERAFLPVLREAVRMLAAERQLPPPLVLVSVRLAEVLAVAAKKSDNPSAWQSAQNQITSKQADFVVCDPKTTRPLLVVELDDQSHGRSDRKDRDAFVDKACGSAGLPILHVRAAASYDAAALARRIGEALSVGKEPAAVGAGGKR